MDLNQLVRDTFGEPIIDTSLSFEETMESFLKDLSCRKWHVNDNPGMEDPLRPSTTRIGIHEYKTCYLNVYLIINSCQY